MSHLLAPHRHLLSLLHSVHSVHTLTGFHQHTPPPFPQTIHPFTLSPLPDPLVPSSTLSPQSLKRLQCSGFHCGSERRRAQTAAAAVMMTVVMMMMAAVAAAVSMSRVRTTVQRRKTRGQCSSPSLSRGALARLAFFLIFFVFVCLCVCVCVSVSVCVCVGACAVICLLCQRALYAAGDSGLWWFAWQGKTVDKA